MFQLAVPSYIQQEDEELLTSMDFEHDASRLNFVCLVRKIILSEESSIRYAIIVRQSEKLIVHSQIRFYRGLPLSHSYGTR